MSLRVAILTASDRSARGERPDLSGPALAGFVHELGWEVVRAEVLPDDLDALSAALASWADSGEMDLILVTGGTGFGPRDVTPEAVRAAAIRLTPGLDEAMRAASLRVTPHAMLSRAVSGIRARTLILSLPGSPKAAAENLQAVLPALPHAIELLRDDPGAERGHAGRPRQKSA